MKNTVDLTADRMFPDIYKTRGPSWLVGETDKYSETLKILTFTFRVPWEFDELTVVNSDEMFTDWRYTLSGSAEEYRRRDEWSRADSIQYCDRCGKKVRTPWRWDRSLCIECSNQLDIDVHKGKVPWDNDSFWSGITTLADVRGVWI